MDLRRIIVFFCVLLYAGDAFSARISITADYKRYDKYRDVLIAKGNVVVKGPDFRIKAPYVIRYFKEDKIAALDSFTFEQEGYKITGRDLEFHPATKSGNAEKVRINFGDTFLGARYMNMDQDAFEMYDAYFSGCSELPTHYHVSAQQVALYPSTGLVVAYYATCWVWIAPVLPVPTFVYSAPVPKSKFAKLKGKAAEAPSKNVTERTEGIKATQPVPEIGANPVDGTFLKQGFNWYFNKKWYLKTSLSYMEKNHFGGSFATNYILNNENEGELRFGSNEIERSYGGISHFISMGPKLLSREDEEWLVYDYYRPGGKYSYEIELTYSNRERPNHEINEGPFTRVSYTPKAVLRSNRKPLPLLGDPFTYYFEASTATVSEEVPEAVSFIDEGYVTSSQMNNYYADILYDADWGWLGKFNGGVSGASSDYNELGSWDRAMQNLSLQQKYFDRLQLTYSHSHYINQEGFSPYYFEGYWYSPFDTFTGSVKVKAWWSYLSMKASYEMPDWDLFKVKYELLLGMHCYNLVFDYIIKRDIDTYRSEFNFSFELVPSRW